MIWNLLACLTSSKHTLLQTTRNIYWWCSDVRAKRTFSPDYHGYLQGVMCYNPVWCSGFIETKPVICFESIDWISLYIMTLFFLCLFKNLQGHKYHEMFPKKPVPEWAYFIRLFTLYLFTLFILWGYHWPNFLTSRKTQTNFMIGIT